MIAHSGAVGIHDLLYLAPMLVLVAMIVWAKVSERRERAAAGESDPDSRD